MDETKAAELARNEEDLFIYRSILIGAFLPKMYAARTLLNEEILTEDIAKAVRVFVDGSLSKSTGNILNVDGGVAVAFVR